MRLVLEKIRKYLLLNFWCCHDLDKIRRTLLSLSLVNRRFSEIFRPSRVLKPYLEKKIKGVIYHPTRIFIERLSFLDYWKICGEVARWRRCPQCYQEIINCCLKLNGKLSDRHRLDADAFLCRRHLARKTHAFDFLSLMTFFLYLNDRYSDGNVRIYLEILPRE